ncbi:MAG: hypothetical protein HOE48_19065 [Candidatus Latescibacteria bacterium]|jgi:hypothetical protein|nr:hypothetical protein [Candidatus Latescibacterota bacterium]MBT4140027.1 hypothetical protein [Candidatus Latescibacterota bacterium]MBT5828661.1 hypothetical protein [Candidatus Latescibacterota bacterium]
MFFDLLTLFMLVIVILVKYGTWKHISVINQDLRNVERSCEYHSRQHQLISQKREGSERDEKALKKDRYGLAGFLERQKKIVEQQKERNEALEKQLI